MVPLNEHEWCEIIHCPKFFTYISKKVNTFFTDDNAKELKANNLVALK